MLQRLRLLAEQSAGRHAQRGGDDPRGAVARAGPAAPGGRRALRGRPRDAGKQAARAARGQRGEARGDPEDGERAAPRRGREADERELQPGDRPVRRGAEGDGRRAGGHRADRRHQAAVLQREDARRLGRDAGARDAGRHPAARRIRDQLQGAAGQQRRGRVRRAYADEGRRTGRCCRSMRSSLSRTTSVCWRHPTPAMRRRSAPRRACWNGACATRRGRSRRSTSTRR